MDSTLSGNSAGYEGGGIHANNSNSLSDVDSTLSGNRALRGAEIYNDDGSNFLPNAGNLSGDNGTDYSVAFEDFTTTANDLIAIMTGTGGSLTNLNIPLNQILDPLEENGCTLMAGTPDEAACLQTHALVAGSPAIDAGYPEFCANNGITTDQRGENRNSACDIGAFELVADELCYVIPANGGNTVVFCL